MVEAIHLLMLSDLEGPVNIGCPQYVTVDELAETVIRVSGKEVGIQHIEGPVGVLSRNFSNNRIYSLGWRPKVYLEEGISYTYAWIEAQVKARDRLPT
jgi:nucleoside-diphosphate-sugar epimerase